jgi:hypothetical protein
MSIKQTISTPIYSSPNGIAAIVDEANDGVKALPTELVVKKDDDSTFEQVSATNPLPVSGAVQLTGSYIAETQTIAAGAQFTTTTIDCGDYNHLTIGLYTNTSVTQANKKVDVYWYFNSSATIILRHQQDVMQGTGNNATYGGAVSIPVVARYAKVRIYNNGPTDTTFGYQIRLTY